MNTTNTTLAVGNEIEVSVPFSSDSYTTTCIAIELEGEDMVVYGADGTRCKIWDVEKINLAK